LPALAASTVKLVPNAPGMMEQPAGTSTAFAETALSHRYHLIVNDGAGNPIQVPPVAVATEPTRGFPVVTVGAASVTFAGSRVTTSVDELTRTFEPESLVRVTSTAMYFPASESVMEYVPEEAPEIAKQLGLTVFALETDVVHRNQRNPVEPTSIVLSALDCAVSVDPPAATPSMDGSLPNAGGLMTGRVDALHVEESPKSLDARTSTAKIFPLSESVMARVVAFDGPPRSSQPSGRVDDDVTGASHSYQK
jgi:hypothetical protein